ncbi:MAG: hypothetical protein M3Y33_14125, partial [Actinomycetota bacterium]|nr:hypothetical protein [Actinomycetota bacterium]
SAAAAARPAEAGRAGRAADLWAPSPADRDAIRALLQKMKGEETGAGWARGVNVVGARPDRSPGDSSISPPTGEKLVAMEKEDISRADKFRRAINREFGDVDDGAKGMAGMIQNWLSLPPPPTHPAAGPPGGSRDAADIPHHGSPSPGAVIETGLVVAVVVVEEARRAMRRWLAG